MDGATLRGEHHATRPIPAASCRCAGFCAAMQAGAGGRCPIVVQGFTETPQVTGRVGPDRFAPARIPCPLYLMPRA